MKNAVLSTTAMLLLARIGGYAENPLAIDAEHSVMTMHVYRAGALSAFGHDHVIAAPIADGSVDFSAHHVELRVDAKTLSVRDPDASEKDRDAVERTMLGPAVLDSGQYPAIIFRS